MNRSAMVMTAAVVVFIGGGLLGITLAFAPPTATTVDTASCEVKTINKGDTLTSNLITVNVYNASDRVGLASQVRHEFQNRNFMGGIAVNNSTDYAPSTVMILTSDKNDPAVQLVAQQFADQVEYASPNSTLERGINVLIGPNYTGMANAPTDIVAGQKTTVCVPTINLNK